MLNNLIVSTALLAPSPQSYRPYLEILSSHHNQCRLFCSNITKNLEFKPNSWRGRIHATLFHRTGSTSTAGNWPITGRPQSRDSVSTNQSARNLVSANSSWPGNLNLLIRSVCCVMLDKFKYSAAAIWTTFQK